MIKKITSKPLIDLLKSKIKDKEKIQKIIDQFQYRLYSLRYLFKPKYIYIVTAIRFGMMYADKKRGKDGIYHSYRKRTKKDQKEYFTIVERRTWGWVHDFKTADECIRTNMCDLYEGCYNMIVIEKVPEHLVVNVPAKEWWYKWEGTWEEGGYVPSEKPEEYHNIVSFWGS